MWACIFISVWFFFGLARFKPGTQDHKDCANWFHLWAVAAVIIGSLK